MFLLRCLIGGAILVLHATIDLTQGRRDQSETHDNPDQQIEARRLNDASTSLCSFRQLSALYVAGRPERGRPVNPSSPSLLNRLSQAHTVISVSSSYCAMAGTALAFAGEENDPRSLDFTGRCSS